MQPFVGVISDTHGLLRPEALDPLRGCELIIHAGDVGDFEILRQLEAIAPVSAVRGNVDYGALAESLPDDNVVTWHGKHLYVLHSIDDLSLDPQAAGFHAVIYGHTHKPDSTLKNGVLFFNPGSAGPRRFSLPVSVGRITLDGEQLRAETVTLEV